MGLIKICGLTNAEDVAAAARLGADLAGFVFAPSPRRVEPDAAARLIADLPAGGPEPVGVFVDETPERVREIVARCGLAWIQLHGREGDDFARDINARVIRAFRVGGARSWDDIVADRADLVLLDSHVPGQAGGTGRTFAWDRIDPRMRSRRYLLAGGLHPGNVQDAIRTTHATGVDASSGLESEPGRKDHDTMEKFVRRARRAWEDMSHAAQ